MASCHLRPAGAGAEARSGRFGFIPLQHETRHQSTVLGREFSVSHNDVQQRDRDARALGRFRGGLSHHIRDFERRISLGFTLITCVSPQLPFALTLRNADRHEADRAVGSTLIMVRLRLVMISDSLLQPSNCFVAISQTEVEQSTPVCDARSGAG